jgi:uncharacterized protein YdbL (DUF1318 family)
MSLPYDPTYTRQTAASLVASTSLGASTTTTFTFAIGDSAASTASALGGALQVYLVATSVSATNGLSITINKSADTTPNYSTVAYATGPTIPAVASSTTSACIDLPPGQYQASIANLDATNAIHYEATLALLQ